MFIDPLVVQDEPPHSYVAAVRLPSLPPHATPAVSTPKPDKRLVAVGKELTVVQLVPPHSSHMAVLLGLG